MLFYFILRVSVPIAWSSPPSLVRVCDCCFEEIQLDRQGTTLTSTQGIVKSGKLSKGATLVLARLSYLTLSLFKPSEDGSADAGKLISAIHLSDIISIRKGRGEHNKCDFTIGDTEGGSLVLRSSEESDAVSWVDAIMQSKNELLDAVRALDLSASAEPHVVLVTARDEATLGHLDVCVSDNVAFRAPFRLPFLTAQPSTAVSVQLSYGTVRVTGSELLASTENDAAGGRSLWVRVRRNGGRSGSGSSKQLQIQIRAEAVDSCPLGVLHVLAFSRWVRGAPFAPTMGEPLPHAAVLLGRLLTQSALNPCAVIASVGFGLLSLGVLRARAVGVASALEGSLAAGLGTLVLAVAAITAAKGGEVQTESYRWKLTIQAYRWEDAAEAAAAAAVAASSRPAEIPERFLRMTRGDVDTALQWWTKTKKWRAKVKPQKMLTEVPRPSYSAIKETIEHYFHKRDRQVRAAHEYLRQHPHQLHGNFSAVFFFFPGSHRVLRSSQRPSQGVCKAENSGVECGGRH